jgi:hypothetical protein
LTNRQTGRDILFRIGRLAGTNFWYRRINDCKRGSFVANFIDGTVLGGSGMKFGSTKSSETATETNSSSSSLHPHCCKTLVIYPLSISSMKQAIFPAFTPVSNKLRIDQKLIGLLGPLYTVLRSQRFICGHGRFSE